MQIETIAAHSGRQLDLGAGAISAPIHLSTTSERDADGAFPRGFEYSRDDNPNRRSPDPAGRRSKRPESCNAGARRSPPRTGLTLLSLIKPSGVASYIVQYRNQEYRTRRLVLGQHGRLTAEQARSMARERLGEVARGVDPSADRHAAREADRASKAR